MNNGLMEYEFLNKEMNYNKLGEVINGEKTFKGIAKNLTRYKNVIVGWCDERYDHRDILFTYNCKKYGTLQRGMKPNYLYVSVIDFNSFGFRTDKTRDSKDIGYIKEKLRLDDTSCDKKICELIIGVINEIYKIETGGK